MRSRGAFFAAALLANASLLQAGMDTAENYYRRGIQFEKAHNYKDAAAQYDLAHLVDLQFAPALKQLGNCHYYLGDKGEAYKDYQLYLLLRPDDRAVAVFAAKLGPPADMAPRTATTGLAPVARSTGGTFFREPGWAKDTNEGAASGDFTEGRYLLVAAITELMKEAGYGPIVQDQDQQRITTAPFVLDPATFGSASGGSTGASLYQLRATLEKGPACTRVEWHLFRVFAATAPGEAPQELMARDPDLNLRLRRDWNWRLQWRLPKTEAPR